MTSPEELQAQSLLPHHRARDADALLFMAETLAEARGELADGYRRSTFLHFGREIFAWLKERDAEGDLRMDGVAFSVIFTVGGARDGLIRKYEFEGAGN